MYVSHVQPAAKSKQLALLLGRRTMVKRRQKWNGRAQVERFTEVLAGERAGDVIPRHKLSDQEYRVAALEMEEKRKEYPSKVR